VVEDSPVNRALAVTTLEVSGYAIDVAADGATAAEAVRAGDFDLVPMDVSMPGMNGFEATVAIRSLPGRQSRLPIVAMTAHGLAGDRKQCLAAGMSDYVAKSVERAALAANVSRWIEKGEPVADDTDSRPPGTGDTLDPNVIAQLKAEVDIDVLPGILDMFSIDLEERLSGILAAGQGDMETLTREPHSLKSMPATIGSDQLNETAKALEIVARAADRTEIVARVATIQHHAMLTPQALKQLRESFG
jgi:CheY-like chemotaxis protein